MAEAIVGPLLGKLQDVVVSEAKALAGVSNDIYILRDKLMWLQAFVREAHLRSRHDGSELARVLAWQMREVASEAEDAVDQFCLHLDRSSGPGGCGWVASGSPGRIGRRLRIRHGLARRVAAMNARLEEIIRNSTMYCRLDGAPPVAVPDDAPKPWRSFRATPVSAAQDWDASELCRLVGREDERNELEKMLLDHNTPGRHLICVLGESGVGKTALVKDAYFDVAIRNNFVVCVWARFPPDTGDSIILQLIYERLVLDCSILYHHELQEIAGQHKPYTAYKDKLSVFLQDHRYMVVIDSPISTTKWNKIRPELPRSANGSKIVLITTPGHAYDTRDCIEVNRLDDYTSEDLFYNQAGIRRYAGTVTDVHGKVKGFTRGLPLAILLLARLLKTMEYDQWDRVFNYIITSNKQADRFTTILSLSFDDLSDELKSCLLYIAGFPAKTLINAGELVHLWMAECFLSQNRGMEMEELGQHYLKELISRGLIQLIKKGVHGDVEIVAVHDHVQSFLRLEAQHTSFMHVHYGCNGALVPANVRRLSLQNYNDKFSAFTARMSMLRSVLSHFKEDYAQEVYAKKSLTTNCRQTGQGTSGEPLGKNASRLDMLQLLQGSPFLRVINLEGYDVGEQLPKKIGTMLHLHYLGIRCPSLTKVPTSIGNLINLETMDIRGTGIRKLPKSFWNIKTLRHVLGDELCFPESAGSLKLLQTLGTMSAEHSSDQFGNILKNMIHLRSLDVKGINIRNSQSLKVAIQELEFLVSLSLSGEAIEMDFTCSSLDQLESLELNGKLVLLPVDHNMLGFGRKLFLLNLSHLVLKSTHVNQAHINELGRLPVLTRLMLFFGSYDGDELVFLPNAFTSLKLIRICRLIDLKKIVVQDKSTMPRLDRFQIVGMPQTSKLIIEALDNPAFDEKIKRYASKYAEY